MDLKYDWLTYEPEAHRTPYGGVGPSVDFVLAPVTSWSARLRMELEADMAKSKLSGLYSWARLVGEDSDRGGTTLVRQAADLAVYGVAPGQTSQDPFDCGMDREYPFMVLDGDLVRRALDWLWFTFSCRLDDRARHAAAEQGTYGLHQLCDRIASRFDVQKHWTPKRAGYFSPDDLEEQQEAGRTLDLEALSAQFERTSKIVRHELWPVMDRAASLGGPSGDWNGWEGLAWFRFVGETDEVRRRRNGMARKVDTQLAADAERLYRSTHPAAPSEGGAREARRRRGIGGYFAEEYAGRLRDTFVEDPDRFLRRGRYGFKPLRDAAGLTERQERTVKERLGYTGDNAQGFEHFVRLLFEADGRPVPKSQGGS